jgi:hypothetical protein
MGLGAAPWQGQPPRWTTPAWLPAACATSGSSGAPQRSERHWRHTTQQLRGRGVQLRWAVLSNLEVAPSGVPLRSRCTWPAQIAPLRQHMSCQKMCGPCGWGLVGPGAVIGGGTGRTWGDRGSGLSGSTEDGEGMDDDPQLQALRSQRLAQMQAQARAAASRAAQGYGGLSSVPEGQLLVRGGTNAAFEMRPELHAGT